MGTVCLPLWLNGIKHDLHFAVMMMEANTIIVGMLGMIKLDFKMTSSYIGKLDLMRMNASSQKQVDDYCRRMVKQYMEVPLHRFYQQGC